MLVLYHLSYVLSTLWGIFIHFLELTYWQDAIVPVACFLLFLVSGKLKNEYSWNWTGQKPICLFFPEQYGNVKHRWRRELGRPQPMVARPGWARATLGCAHHGALLCLSVAFPYCSGKNRHIGFCPVQFREYAFFSFSQTKNSKKRQLALRHLVNRLVPESV